MDVGTRVIRSPQWSQGDIDGGQGHAGTVVKLRPQSDCDVIWDNGQRTNCLAGRDGKHDLLVLDSGPTGLVHTNIQCTGCDVIGIAGIRWTCRNCTSVHLCSACYGEAKHDTEHEFVRFDTPGSIGVQVESRKSSHRDVAYGLYKDALVKRGPDWPSRDNGGVTEGKIISVEDHPSGASVRSMVRVEWGEKQTGLYRAGHGGKVDVQCVRACPGLNFYADHLANLTVASQASSNSTGRESFSGMLVRRFNHGDKVCINVSIDKLIELQTMANIWKPLIVELASKYGHVKSYTPQGHVSVIFGGFIGAIIDMYTLDVVEDALIKVTDVRIGDIVRVSSDADHVRLLQYGHGSYTADTTYTLGKVGRVRHLTEMGDAVVSFGPSAWQFNPANLRHAPGQEEEVISENLWERMQNYEIGFGNYPDAETHVDGHVTSDRQLVKMANALYDAFSRNIPQLFFTIYRMDTRLKNILHKGYTPLILASAFGRKSYVEEILQDGAGVNIPDVEQHTPLLHAIYREQDDIIPLLLQHGADPNTRGKDGVTPLMLSVITEKAQYMEPLLEKGADSNAQDDRKSTAAHMAIEMQYHDCLAVLLKHPDFNPRITNRRNFNCIHFATIKGNTRAMEMLLERFPDIVEDAMPENKFTALHIAANHNQLDCVPVLVDKGHADVNARNELAMTPLMLACANVFVDMVALLIEKGTDVSLGDSSGDTALFYAVKSVVTLNILQSKVTNESLRDSRVQIIRTLMVNGADAEKKNHIGFTAIDMAMNNDMKSTLIRMRDEIRQAVNSLTSTDSNGNIKDTPAPASFILPCSQCVQNRVDTELIPCRHRLVCRTCVSRVKLCPLCKRDIENVAELQVSEPTPPEESCRVQ